MRAALVLLLLAGCSSLPVYPRRACLYDGAKRFNSGTVVAAREDGAQLFRYDDQGEGDHGFIWVEDTARLRPCRTADPFSAEIRNAQSKP